MCSCDAIDPTLLVPSDHPSLFPWVFLIYYELEKRSFSLLAKVLMDSWLFWVPSNLNYHLFLPLICSPAVLDCGCLAVNNTAGAFVIIRKRT